MPELKGPPAGRRVTVELRGNGRQEGPTLDLIEPARPVAGGLVVELLAPRTFKEDECTETPEGRCGPPNRSPAEEVRFQQEGWKAGYAAARRHRSWPVVGPDVGVIVPLRRLKRPVVAFVDWGSASVLACWPAFLPGST